MNVITKLTAFNERLSDMLEELDTIMDETTNTELRDVLELSVSSLLNNTIEMLDTVLDDSESGIYDESSEDEEEEEWD
jgi:hypothetical protein